MENHEKAQAFLQQQLKADWVSLLDEVALRFNPPHNELFGSFFPQYYWTCFQSEWATDVVFDINETLQRMYPSFIQHGITTFRSPDVMRFPWKNISLSNKFPALFNDEVRSDVKTNYEGVRIKHKSDGNSVKMYGKAATEKATVLRIETMIQHTELFKALRSKQGGDPDDLAVRPLRKGLDDLSRRADAGHACNERYLDSQANANKEERLGGC